MVELHTASATQTTTFASLPNELLKCIVDHLARSTDLVALCLTSKRVHEAAVRSLYRHIELYLGDGTEDWVVSMLKPSNIGLQHIKMITIYPSEKHGRAQIIGIAHLTVRMLLEFLPPNLLEAFVWTLHEPMRLSNYKLLLRTQRKLKWLQSTCLEQNVPDTDDCSAMLERLQDINTLSLAPHCRSSLKMCRSLMQHAGKHLSALEIISRSSNDKFFDTANGTGTLNQEIFFEQIAEQMMNQPALSPRFEPRIQLKRLVLQGVQLTFGAKTYVSFIDVAGLEELTLYSCPGAESLLKELCKPKNLPFGLRELWVSHRDDAEGDGMASVDSLLGMINRLKKLCLDFEECKTLPQASSIIRHSGTLEYMVVHATTGSWSIKPSEELRFGLTDWDKICRACQALKQLSISISPPSVLSPYTDPTNLALYAIHQLSNLRTIQLTPYPTTPFRPFDADRYTHLLRLIAAHTFQAHKTTRPGKSLLKLISFGASDPHNTDKTSASSYVFVEACEPQHLGEALDKTYETMPEQTTPCEAKYVADNSDVLRVYLGVSKDAPPTRREDSSDEPEGWALLT